MLPEFQVEFGIDPSLGYPSDHHTLSNHCRYRMVWQCVSHYSVSTPLHHPLPALSFDIALTGLGSFSSTHS